MSTMLEAIGEHKISLSWEENNFDCYLDGDGDCGDGGVMAMMILTKMEMMIM